MMMIRCFQLSQFLIFTILLLIHTAVGCSVGKTLLKESEKEFICLQLIMENS